MAGSRTAKGHSTGILIFRKRLFARATTALPRRPRANRGLSDPQRRCSTRAYPVGTNAHNILERPVAARHRLIGRVWPTGDWRVWAVEMSKPTFASARATAALDPSRRFRPGRNSVCRAISGCNGQ
jgi:hypothetical protein